MLEERMRGALETLGGEVGMLYTTLALSAPYRGGARTVEGMSNDEDASNIGERLTGERDPKNPDGLLSLDGPDSVKDTITFGHAEPDTLAKERERRSR
ncbi:hypothetical protein WDJ51_01715 [Rathayibacter sp. YIM 133350]|uniref:hypothetical protein n=1 Tax=Rathayibacter sp. YIM 133350 TaxID=3131992 RepID=UPI00307E783E